MRKWMTGVWGGFALLLLAGCEQRLASGKVSAFGRFGRSVASFETTALVGAYQENNQAGAAYLYATPGGVLGPQVRLLPTDPSSSSEFGSALALGSNLAAVGAHFKNAPGALRAGAVYVFRNLSGAWLQTSKLVPPTPEAEQGFGDAIALTSNTLVVGSPQRDVDGHTNAGNVYVYRSFDFGWLLATVLTAPSNAAGDRFGADVAIVGDRLFVGAPGRSSAAVPHCGAVYVFALSGSTWVYSQTLRASDRATDDGFGGHLAIATVNGQRQLMIGAPGADLPNALDAGAAYVFSDNGAGSYAQAQKLTASDPTMAAHFGGAVGALNARAVVGAAGLSAQRGAAYVFDHQAGAFVQVVKLTATDVAANDLVGDAVAVSGLGAVLVGAPGTEVDPAVSEGGAVHVFGESSGWSEVVRLAASERTASDQFGQDVSLSGDWAAIVSAGRADVLRRDAGFWSLTQQFGMPDGYVISNVALSGDRLAVFGKHVAPDSPVGRIDVYALGATGSWALEQTLIPDLANGAFPAEAANTPNLSLLGDRLVLGAPRFGGGDGRVFVYLRSAALWNLVQTFNGPSASTTLDQNFGRWVRQNATTLAIAEVPNITEPFKPKNGKVHIYDLSGGTFQLSQTLTAPVPADVDWFGKGLALSPAGLLAVVGEGSTLRVYSRTGGSYVQDWQSVLTGFGSYPDLEFEAERLAVGVSGASFDSFTGAGEVQIFLRQPDASWTLERTERAGDARSGQGVGTRLALDGGRLLVGTGWGIGDAYAF